jgi:hypothetical protein
MPDLPWRHPMTPTEFPLARTPARFCHAEACADCAGDDIRCPGEVCATCDYRQGDLDYTCDGSPSCPCGAHA